MKLKIILFPITLIVFHSTILSQAKTQEEFNLLFEQKNKTENIIIDLNEPIKNFELNSCDRNWNLTQSNHNVIYSPSVNDPLYSDVSQFPVGDINSNYLGPVLQQILDDAVGDQVMFVPSGNLNVIIDDTFGFTHTLEYDTIPWGPFGQCDPSQLITPEKLNFEAEEIMCKIWDRIIDESPTSYPIWNMPNSSIYSIEIEFIYYCYNIPTNPSGYMINIIYQLRHFEEI